MADSGQSGDGKVVDLAAFRRSSEDRKLRELSVPESRPAAIEDPASREQIGGLVVAVGRDVWPGTAPLDTLTAKAWERDDLELLGECRAAALAESADPLQPDDVEDGVAVLQRFLIRLGDEGLRLIDADGIGEDSVADALLGDGNIGLWKGQGLAAPPSHPARRVRSAASALGLVRVRGRVLIATRRGAMLRHSPAALWDHVVSSLPLERTPGGREAGLLVLLLAAAGRATPDRDFSRMVNSVGKRLRLNSPDPDHGPWEPLREAARTVDVLNGAGQGRIARLELDPPRFPPWAGLHWGPACHLARAAVARLS